MSEYFSREFESAIRHFDNVTRLYRRGAGDGSCLWAVVVNQQRSNRSCLVSTQERASAMT